MKYKLSVYFANLGLEDVKMNCSTVALQQAVSY